MDPLAAVCQEQGLVFSLDVLTRLKLCQVWNAILFSLCYGAYRYTTFRVCGDRTKISGIGQSVLTIVLTIRTATAREAYFFPPKLGLFTWRHTDPLANEPEQNIFRRRGGSGEFLKCRLKQGFFVLRSVLKESIAILLHYLIYTYIKEPDFFTFEDELLLGHWPQKAEIWICCWIWYGECTC